MVQCSRCQHPVDETTRKTCPVCLTPLAAAAGTPPAAPAPISMAAAPSPSAGQAMSPAMAPVPPYAAAPAAPAYPPAMPGQAAPVVSNGYAPAAQQMPPPAYGINPPAQYGQPQMQRVGLNGEVISAPTAYPPAAPPPVMPGGYAPAYGASRPGMPPVPAPRKSSNAGYARPAWVTGVLIAGTCARAFHIGGLLNKDKTPVYGSPTSSASSYRAAPPTTTYTSPGYTPAMPTYNAPHYIPQTYTPPAFPQPAFHAPGSQFAPAPRFGPGPHFGPYGR